MLDDWCLVLFFVGIAPVYPMPHLALDAMVIVLQSPWVADELGLHHQEAPALRCCEKVQSLLALHKGSTMSDAQERATAMAAERWHASLLHLQVVVMAKLAGGWLLVIWQWRWLAAVVGTMTSPDIQPWRVEPALRVGVCAAPRAHHYETLG